MALKCPYKPQILIVCFYTCFCKQVIRLCNWVINFAFKRTSINPTNHIIKSCLQTIFIVCVIISKKGLNQTIYVVNVLYN